MTHVSYHRPPADDEATMERNVTVAVLTYQLGIMQRAASRVSAMAPEDTIGVEDVESKHGMLDDGQREAVCYDQGLGHVADIMRHAMVDTGCCVPPGTHEWYHDDADCDDDQT